MQRNEAVAKDIVDKLVHGRLLKLASLSRASAELCRSLDLLCQEFRDVYAGNGINIAIDGLEDKMKEQSLTNTAILSAEHLPWYACTFHLLTVVLGIVAFVSNVEASGAIRQTTVEGFDLADPELEAARLVGNIACERHLRWTIRQHIDNLAV